MPTLTTKLKDGCGFEPSSGALSLLFSRSLSPRFCSSFSLVFRRAWSRRFGAYLAVCSLLICERSYCSAVVVPVVWLKWPASIGSGIYLFIHHQPAAGVLALVWSFVAGWIGAATSFPTYVGTIELAFAKKIGYVSPDAEL